MTSCSSPTINLIGAGRLGRTLAKLWSQHGLLHVQQLLTRTTGNVEKAQQFIGDGQAITQWQDLTPASLWLIATPDNAIETAAQQLADTSLLRTGDIVFHCSGALSSEALSACLAQGAVTASIHPVHSFATPANSIEQFQGTPCACEGDDAALKTLQPLFNNIGANCFELASANKTLYHAGSVMACNYLITLLEASREAFQLAGLTQEQTNELMKPIVHQTADNLLNNQAADVLTGPIARGDSDTVSKQLKQLQNKAPDLAAIYASLGHKTVAIAKQQGNTSAEQLDAIAQLLHASSDIKSHD